MMSACAPSADQVKKIIEENPQIVFSAIQKDPENFIKVVNEAARKAQEKSEQSAMEEENKKRDEQFKNPIKPVIEEGRVIFGKKDAPITIVEYSDFQCPYCSKGYNIMKQVIEAYGDKVRIVFKHLPLDFHPKAEPAARYFEAVAKQSHEKAEQLHNKIFENQESLSSKGEDFLKDEAKKLGVDMKKLATDLMAKDIKERIAADTEEARKFGFSGTPGFSINGVTLKGAYPFDSFKEIIDKHLASAK